MTNGQVLLKKDLFSKFLATSVLKDITAKRTEMELPIHEEARIKKSDMYILDYI